MKKIFTIGKFALRPTTRKSNRLDVAVELNYNKNNLPVFYATALIWNSTNTMTLTTGQCFDYLLKRLPELKDNQLFMTIYDLWYKHHRNDMDASANDEQRNAVKEYCEKHNGYSYEGVCDFLKRKKLYTVIVDGKSCCYGYGWWYRSIPNEDLNKILELFS